VIIKVCFFLKKLCIYLITSPPPSNIYGSLNQKKKKKNKHIFNGEIYCSHVLYNVFLYLEVLLCIYISNIMIIHMTIIEKKNACITLNKQTYVMEPRNQSKKKW
jgi:hypothetical protein